MIEDILPFLNALRYSSSIDKEFPLQYLQCLIIISLEEGISFSDLSKEAKIGLSTTSRIVHALGDKRQKGTPYHMVKVIQDPENKRRKMIYLTDKGEKFVNRIAAILNGYY